MFSVASSDSALHEAYQTSKLSTNFCCEFFGNVKPEQPYRYPELYLSLSPCRFLSTLSPFPTLLLAVTYINSEEWDDHEPISRREDDSATYIARQTPHSAL